MLPPPTTRHSPGQCSRAAWISRASASTASASMPNCSFPISASPDSFKRIRLKRGRVIRWGRPLDVERAAPLLWRSRPNANRLAVAGQSLGDGLGFGRSRGGRDLGGEVAFLFLDALAELEADEALELNARPGLLGGGGDDFGDRRLVVDHEQLRQQRIVLAELGDRAFDHLLDNVRRLAALLRLFHRDAALALD